MRALDLHKRLASHTRDAVWLEQSMIVHCSLHTPPMLCHMRAQLPANMLRKHICNTHAATTKQTSGAPFELTVLELVRATQDVA